MSKIQLNTYIEWTKDDLIKGKSPVPEGSDVTVWLSNYRVFRDAEGRGLYWGPLPTHVLGYLVHSVPKKPIVRWLVEGGNDGDIVFNSEKDARTCAISRGGRVIELVEEDNNE